MRVKYSLLARTRDAVESELGDLADSVRTETAV